MGEGNEMNGEVTTASEGLQGSHGKVSESARAEATGGGFSASAVKRLMGASLGRLGAMGLAMLQASPITPATEGGGRTPNSHGTGGSRWVVGSG